MLKWFGDWYMSLGDWGKGAVITVAWLLVVAVVFLILEKINHND